MLDFAALAPALPLAADPNWFYSTSAQSAAAIVGLAGGFLAARLVGHRAEVAKDRESLKHQFDYLVGTFRGTSSRISTVHTSLSTFLEAAERDRYVETRAEIGLAGLLSLSTRGYPSPGGGTLNQAQLNALVEFHDVTERLKRTLDLVEDSAELGELLANGIHLPIGDEQWLEEDLAIPPTPATYWEDLANQREYAKQTWQELRNDYEPMRSRVVSFRSRLVPTTFILLLASLALLLLVGAIVPMAFLSARDAVSKILVLIAFTVFSLGVAGVLAYEMFRISRAANLSRETF
jgi:hypothetical protein